MSASQIIALETMIARLENEQNGAAERGDVEYVQQLAQTLSMAYSALGAAQLSMAG